MVIRRGDIHWTDLGGRRPVLVVQAQPYTDSRLPTVVAVAISANTGLAALPGNVCLSAASSGLPDDAVVTVTALVTVDKAELGDPVGSVPHEQMLAVDAGLRRILGI